MGNLTKRLEALEQASPIPQAEAEPLTLDELTMWACFYFQWNELTIDEHRHAIVNHAKLRKDDPDYDSKLARLTPLAKFVNELRGDKPFLPLTPDDGIKALEALRRKHVFVAERPNGPRYSKFTADYRLGHPDYMHATKVERMLDPAVRVYLASGGVLEPFTTEEVIKLLETCLAEVDMADVGKPTTQDARH